MLYVAQSIPRGISHGIQPHMTDEQQSETVGQYGEFRLIDRLNRFVKAGAGVIVGIGDDTAVLEKSPSTVLLATCDGQVEGVHFLRESTSATALGHRALAVNLSDIAAMGGTALWALVALTLPTNLPVTWVDDLYCGMTTLADQHGVSIVGGNLSGSPGGIVIDITLLGEVAADRRLTRSEARPGDAIIVTGVPGESAAGLELILRPALRERVPSDVAERLIRRHQWPQPRLAAGRRLADLGCITAAIDVSDGLTADLSHILDASNVGATLEAARLPISETLATFATAVGRQADEFVLTGGEAYELLITCPPERCDEVIAALVEVDVSAARIGFIEERAGLRLVDYAGSMSEIDTRGHDHFATEERR